MPTPAALATDSAVAVLIAPGLEEVEALAPVDILYRAGIRADLVSVTNSLAVGSSHEVDLADYALVLLPGGIPGTPNLKAVPAVRQEIARRMNEDLPLAAVCAAPSILAEMELLQGRRATSNPAFMDVLAEHGARVSEEAVVADGALLTSRGMGTAIELGLEMVRRLLDEEAAAKVRSAIVHQS